ncbi:UNVERIFIED_CONTAM: hypothetical protein Sangu_3193500 [Sesamum angustifolium]|uniref:Reverse transcriptase zinc-binding domain-containing protein n=1 Tax=Sesamum angustifolium TaxID=2727405 RepID=A0AAW2JPS3_9LAMI
MPRQHHLFSRCIVAASSMVAMAEDAWKGLGRAEKSGTKDENFPLARTLWKGKCESRWDQICKPKTEGGFDMQRFGHSNVQRDIWHERGPLCLSYPRGPAVTGLPLSSTLSSVLQGNQWCWPASTDADIVEIMSQLPPTQPSAADRICWISASGKYTLQSAKLLLQPTTPRVHWHGLIQGKFKIPRHGFILWLAFLERLSTMDKPWVPRAADACVLCDGQFIETHDHLFFKCWFSKRCLTILKNKVKFQWPYLEWKQGTTWASKMWRGNHLINEALRATLAALVYHIWAERNNRKFAATSSSAESTANKVLEEIRMRIMAAEIPPSLQTRVLYRIWKLAWPFEQ